MLAAPETGVPLSARLVQLLSRRVLTAVCYYLIHVRTRVFALRTPPRGSTCTLALVCPSD